MIRALTADEVVEAKRLHDALKPANDQQITLAIQQLKELKTLIEDHDH